MDPVRIYDVLTQARRRLFDWIRPLDQTQYTRRFPFGMGTLRATMTEIARGEFWLGMRLTDEPVPPFVEWPFSETRLPTFAGLETAWGPLAAKTRRTLAATSDWDRRATRELVFPGKTITVTATKADIAAQLLMHEVHHRAQAMAMLRQLGVPAQDLDYIEFVQEREDRPR